MKIHHYGLATNDLERSIEAFKDLGFCIGETIEDPIQKVRISFVSCEGGHFIELICDMEPGQGPTSRIVSQIGTHFYHLCFEVEDIENTIKEFREKGYLLRHKPVPAAAFNGRRIAWLYHRTMGLVELLEAKTKDIENE